MKFHFLVFSTASLYPESFKHFGSYLLVVIFLVVSVIGSSQESISERLQKSIALANTDKAELDTVAKYINQLYYYGNFESAYEYSIKYESAAKKFSTHIEDLLIIQARYLMRNGEVEQAKSTLLEVDRSTDSSDYKEKSYNWYFLSRLYTQVNRLDSAIYYNFLADSVSTHHGLYRYKGLVERAGIYIKQGQIQRGLETADLAYDLGESKADSVNHLWLLYTIALIHADHNSPKKYAKYAREYVEYESKRKTKYHRGIFDLEYKNISERIGFMEEVRRAYKEEGFKRGVHLSKMALVNLYTLNQEYRKAYDLLLELSSEVLTNNFENSSYDHYQRRFELEKKLGLSSQALFSAEKLMELRDTMQSAALTKQTLEIETQYKTREKEREIQFLNAENELKDLALKRSAQLRYLLGAGILLLIILAISLFRNIMQARKHNSELTEKNEIINRNLVEKEDLLKEIHHRVKNNLQIISSLLRLQSRSIEDEDAKEVLKEGQNRVQSMALIHQSLYKEENRTGLEVQNYFEKLCNNLIETYNIGSEEIDLNLKIQAINLDVSTMIPLGLIVNELLTNSLKYAFNDGEQGSIEIALFEKANTLHLSVKDDGVGIPPEIIEFLNQDSGKRNSKFGFGTRLIRTFAKKLDASIKANGDAGTSIEFLIKDYKVLPL